MECFHIKNKSLDRKKGTRLNGNAHDAFHSAPFYCISSGVKAKRIKAKSKVIKLFVVLR